MILLKDAAQIKENTFRDGVNNLVLTRNLVRGGDVMELSEGSRVPADGCVLAANAAFRVDEEEVTGNSDPVTKTEGDTVYMSSLVRRGKAYVEVTRTGNGTLLGRNLDSHLKSSNRAPRACYGIDIPRAAFKIWLTLAVPAAAIVGAVCVAQSQSYLQTLLHVLAMTTVSAPVQLAEDIIRLYTMYFAQVLSRHSWLLASPAQCAR